jgi:sec-independent protein translocase protein TatB
MFNVGPGELVAILALALIVLGPNRLPEAVRTVGRVVGELRRISSGFQEELRNALDDSDVERDLDRLRSRGDGRDGGDQRELPLDDQPELPLGSVQYPSGFEPIDVDPTDTSDPSAATVTDDADPPVDVPPVEDPMVDEPPVDEPTVDEPTVEDPTVDDPTAANGDTPGDPAPGTVDDARVDAEAGRVDVYADEPDKNPAIDDDPDEPYEPPATGGDGNGERAVS